MAKRTNNDLQNMKHKTKDRVAHKPCSTNDTHRVTASDIFGILFYINNNIDCTGRQVNPTIRVSISFFF